MNYSIFRRLISSATAGLLCLSSVSFSAAADNNAKSSADNNIPHVRKIVKRGDVTAYFLDCPPPASIKTNHISKKVSANAGGDDDDFINRCMGIRYGYDFLKSVKSSGAARSLYNSMYECAVELWNNPDDVVGKWENVFDDSTNSYSQDYIIKYIEPTVPFDPNDKIEETQQTAFNTYFLFRADNPLFYFYGTYAVIYNEGSIAIKVDDMSYCNGAKRASYQQAIKNYVKSSESLVHNDYTRTDYQNALELYKKVMDGMSYANDENGVPSGDSMAHNILGGILNKSGVCESYSKIYGLLLNYNGIENIHVTGIGAGDYHAWNLIKLDDGKYYYADSTWDDDGDHNDNNNMYFAKGSLTFSLDHFNDDSKMTYGTYLYDLPETAAADFDPAADHRATNTRLIDFDKSGSVTNHDIKALQKLIIGSNYYLSYYDVNNDKKVNNRDLKALQRLITSLK